MEVSVEPSLTIVIVYPQAKVAVISGACRYGMGVAASEDSPIAVVIFLIQRMFSAPACNTYVPQYDDPVF